MPDTPAPDLPPLIGTFVGATWRRFWPAWPPTST